jgi:hypothetical protein
VPANPDSKEYICPLCKGSVDTEGRCTVCQTRHDLSKTLREKNTNNASAEASLIPIEDLIKACVICGDEKIIVDKKGICEHCKMIPENSNKGSSMEEKCKICGLKKDNHPSGNSFFCKEFIPISNTIDQSRTVRGMNSREGWYHCRFCASDEYLLSSDKKYCRICVAPLKKVGKHDSAVEDDSRTDRIEIDESSLMDSIKIVAISSLLIIWCAVKGFHPFIPGVTEYNSLESFDSGEVYSSNSDYYYMIDLNSFNLFSSTQEVDIEASGDSSSIDVSGGVYSLSCDDVVSSYFSPVYLTTLISGEIDSITVEISNDDSTHHCLVMNVEGPSEFTVTEESLLNDILNLFVFLLSIVMNIGVWLCYLLLLFGIFLVVDENRSEDSDFGTQIEELQPLVSETHVSVPDSQDSVEDENIDLGDIGYYLIILLWVIGILAGIFYYRLMSYA